MAVSRQKQRQRGKAKAIRRRFASALAALLAWLACGLPTNVRANELIVTQSALLAVLKSQAFRTGRLDLVTPTPCAYAYLESPTLVVTKGRVALGAKLTGRAAVPAGNQCVGGLGDAVDIVASGRAFYRDGRIGLDDLRIDQISNEFYRPILAPMLQVAVGRVVDIDLREAIRQMLADGRVPLTVDVEQLDVSRLVAEDNRIEAAFTFRAVAR